MKIKSKFKDYYDYVANQYGGGDPNIVYIRQGIGEKEFTGSIQYYKGIAVDFERQFNIPRYSYGDLKGYPTGGFKGLVVAGRMFPLIDVADRSNNQYATPRFEVLDFRKHEHLLKTNRWKSESTFIPDWKSINISDNLIKVSRKIGHPVFVINKVNSYIEKTVIHVDSECPILGDLGLATYFPPDQLYQELSYFIGNLVNESPDIMPRPKVTDKDKIVSHGFDLKQSFRHRK